MLYTRCKHDVTGHEAELPTDVAGTWQRLGWQPISEPRTEADADAERAAEAVADAERVAEVTQAVAADKPPVIDDVLELVSDDPAAAQVALDAELARPKPRTTLVDRLTHITAGDAGTT